MQISVHDNPPESKPQTSPDRMPAGGAREDVTGGNYHPRVDDCATSPLASKSTAAGAGRLAIPEDPRILVPSDLLQAAPANWVRVPIRNWLKLTMAIHRHRRAISQSGAAAGEASQPPWGGPRGGGSRAAAPTHSLDH